MKRPANLLCLVGLLAALAGCGGAGGTSQDRSVTPQFVVAWPERSRNADAPPAALSLQAQILDHRDAVVANLTADRPGGTAPESVTYRFPSPLPSGTYRTLLRFYAAPGAGGDVVAEAVSEAVLDAANATFGPFTFSSTVASLTILETTLLVGQEKRLPIEARTSDGRIVALTEGSYRIDLLDGHALELDGWTVRAVSKGEGTVIARSGNVASAPRRIPVGEAHWFEEIVGLPGALNVRPTGIAQGAERVYGVCDLPSGPVPFVWEAGTARALPLPPGYAGGVVLRWDATGLPGYVLDGSGRKVACVWRGETPIVLATPSGAVEAVAETVAPGYEADESAVVGVATYPDGRKAVAVWRYAHPGHPEVHELPAPLENLAFASAVNDFSLVFFLGGTHHGSDRTYQFDSDAIASEGTPWFLRNGWGRITGQGQGFGGMVGVLDGATWFDGATRIVPAPAGATGAILIGGARSAHWSAAGHARRAGGTRLEPYWVDGEAGALFIEDYLRGIGADLRGMTLEVATAHAADPALVVGTGRSPGSDQLRAWIARLPRQGGYGL